MNPLGRKVMIFVCNWCDFHEEQPDFQDYDNLDEIVYEMDNGCSHCRQKEHGFTPYISYVRNENVD